MTKTLKWFWVMANLEKDLYFVSIEAFSSKEDAEEYYADFPYDLIALHPILESVRIEND